MTGSVKDILSAAGIIGAGYREQVIKDLFIGD